MNSAPSYDPIAILPDTIHIKKGREGPTNLIRLLLQDKPDLVLVLCAIAARVHMYFPQDVQLWLDYERTERTLFVCIVSSSTPQDALMCFQAFKNDETIPYDPIITFTLGFPPLMALT